MHNFLIFLIDKVLISMECETRESETDIKKLLKLTIETQGTRLGIDKMNI